MTNYLDSKNFPDKNICTELDKKLATLLARDYTGNFYSQLAGYQRVLADNLQPSRWPVIYDKLRTLFMCGRAIPLDGPMVGIPMSIKDSDFFQGVGRKSAFERSDLARLDLLAHLWNATFADTGLWMGKTFEPVTREVVKQKCNDNPDVMAAYDKNITRIGRNFFREIADPNPFQTLGLPAITLAWKLKARPLSVNEKGFDGTLLQHNLDMEKAIPYSRTGGFYLADMGNSVLPDMAGKPVYALNYRWPNLHPSFPMTCLIDEIVQIDEGIYLGQLIYATRHFSLGAIELPHMAGVEAGEPYTATEQDYGYQNNGYFMLMDPAYATQIYADTAFPQLRPHPQKADDIKPDSREISHET